MQSKTLGRHSKSHGGSVMVKQLTTTSIKVFRKLNDKLIEKLAGYVAEGNYYSTACHACGISEDAFYDWMRQAASELEKGVDEAVSLPLRLIKAIKNAEAEAEAERVARIRDAGKKGNWLADMTHLERRHPERWGRKDRINNSNSYNINIDKAIIDAGKKFEEILQRRTERDAQGELTQGESARVLSASPPASPASPNT